MFDNLLSFHGVFPRPAFDTSCYDFVTDVAAITYLFRFRIEPK